MVHFWIMLASGIVAAPPASAVTLEQAAALSPAALGDRLLPPGHGLIVQKNIGPEGLDAPPPPGAPVTTEIRLWDAGHDGSVSGVCEKTRYTVLLQPVSRNADGSLPPAKPAKITTTETFRWKPQTAGSAPCEANASEFFTLANDKDSQRVFRAIRLLAEAQHRVKSRQKLTFTGSIDDVLGRETASLTKKDPAFAEVIKQNNPEASNQISDWKAALAQYPIDKVNRYFFINSDSLAQPNESRIIVFDAAGDGGWLQAAVTIKGSHIDKIDLKRWIPAPF